MGTIHCRIEENIARIVKAARHKCPGKSSLNVNHVFPVCFVYPVCPVSHLCPVSVFLSRGSCQMSPRMTCLVSLHGRI